MINNATDIYTMDKLKEASYVMIEVTPKDGPLERTYGLFMGIDSVVRTNTAIASTNELFVFLWKDPVIHMFNLDRYDVTQIEIGAKTAGSSSRYFSKNEQVEVLQKLRFIHNAMKEAGRMMDGSLVDTDKYNVPDAIKSKIKETTKSTTTTGTSSGNWNRSGGQSYNQHACGYSGNYSGGTYVHKTVSTTWMQRTSKYPIEAAITRMRAKIAEIKEGTYKPPQLTEIPYDKKKSEGGEDEKKAVTQSGTTPTDTCADSTSEAYEAALRQMENHDMFCAWG